MLLRHIHLQLNGDEYPRRYGSEFGFRTRYVSNFVERQARSSRFHADGFNGIVVEGASTPTDGCPIVGEHAAAPQVAFDEERYQRLARDEHHEFFMGMLVAGFEKCARFHEIPLEELKSAVDAFRRGSYENAWIHRAKLLRPAGVRASLRCSLDMERFVLTLKLERKKEVVFEEPILETEPDELIFAYQFKDVVLEDGSVVVKDKFGDPLYSVELEALS